MMSASTSFSPRRLALMPSMRLREAVVVDVALAVGGGVEVDAVDDALEQRIGVGDGAQVGGELLADLAELACG